MIDFKWLNDLILLSGATQLHLRAKTLCCMEPEREEESEEETVI